MISSVSSQERSTPRTSREEDTMATTGKVTGFKYAATILGAFAVLAVAPAPAFAVGNGPTRAGGGCTYIDKDDYDMPIDDGQDVFIDGKLVSCRGGKIVIATAPQRAQVRPPVLNGGNLPVLTKQP
jgi:hypothetical protein